MGASMLGKVIALHRQEMGMTQEQLAETVGVARGTIAQLETGIIEWPRLETLQKIAKTLKVSIQTLLQEAGIAKIDPDVEKEMVELVSEVPEFRELFAIAKKYPQKLPELLAYARWITKEMQEQQPK